MALYTKTAAGGMVKGGKKAARRLHMKGPRRDGLPEIPKKKRQENGGGRWHGATYSSFAQSRFW